MKKLTPKSLRFIPAALCLLFTLLANHAQGQVTTYYWDTNGATPGSGGPSPSGNWEDQNWTTDATGSSATVNWVEGSFPVFSAGSDATSSYTITANSDHTIAGMELATNSASATINGPGVLSIADGMQGFLGGTATTPFTINAVLAGTGGFENQGGVMQLYATNTYSGGTMLNGGQIYLNNGGAFGTGTINPVAAGFSALLASGGAPITLTNAFAVTNVSGGINFASAANTPVTCTGNWNLQNDLHVRNNGNSTAPLTLSGVLSGAGGVSLSGNNSGTIVLSGANTFTGPVSIPSQSDGNAGGPAFTVYVSSFNSVNGGTPLLASSSLGCPTTVANGTINLCYDSATNILVYTGPGETTDRILAIYGTARGPWIQADGSGPLVFTSNLSVPYGGASANTKWITLQGTNTGWNTIAGVIPNCQTNTSQYQVGVNKDGTGTWVLTGANTCSGSPLSIYAGTLIIGGSGYVGSGIYSGLIYNAGTLIYASSATQTNSGNMWGSGSLIVSNDAAKLWLSGTNSWPSITIAAGTLIGNHANPGAFAPGVVFTFGSSGHSGTLDLFGRTTSGIGGLVVDPGATGATIQNGGTGNANLGFSGGTSAFSGNIVNGPGSGTTAITMASGSLTLSGNNTFTAGVTVNGGSTFAVGSDTAAGTGAINLNSVGATIQSADGNTRTLANAITLSQNANFGYPGTGNLTFNGTVNSGGAAKTCYVNGITLTFNGVISGNGVANALTLNGSGGTMVFGGANTYQKITTVTSGTLQISGSGTLGATVSPLNVNGGTLDLGGTSQTVAAVTISSGTIQNGTLTGSSYACSGGTISAVLAGSGALTQSGSSTLLSGANTYTGSTTVNSGTLEVGSANGLASPTVTVADGATLQLDTPTALKSSASLILNAGAPSVSLSFLGTNTIQRLSFDGGVTFAAPGTWSGPGFGGANTDSRLAGPGILNVVTLSTTNVVQSIVNNGNGTFTLNLLGTPGASYYVVTSGNVATPLASWTPLVGSTNSASSPSGQWSFVVSNAAPAFYRGVAVNPAP